MAATPKWRRFENLVADLQRSLSPDAVVTQNERVRGKTGALRELDITIRQRVAQFDILVVIDCKDYQAAVNVKNVEAFAGLLDDVGANKGAIVASNGFTSTAKTLARMKGVDLFRLVDTHTLEWCSYVTVPALVRDLRLRWRAVFEGRIPLHSLNLNQDTPLFAEDGSASGNVREQVMNLWKYGGIPEEPGEGSIRPAADERLFIKDGERLVRIGVRIDTHVWYDWYLGEIALTTVRGFVNEFDGSFKANQFETEWLHFADIKKKWQKIDSPENLAIRPMITFLLKDAPTNDPDAARSMRVSVSPSPTAAG